MSKKWTPHIIAVWAFVVFIVLGLACASAPDTPRVPEIVYKEVPYSELKERIEQVKSPGQGFIVEAYFRSGPGDGTSDSFGLLPKPLNTYKDFWEYDKETAWIKGHGRAYRGYRGQYETYADSLQVEEYNSQTYKRIDKSKAYKIYISVHNVFGDRDGWIPIIDKIEGLMTLEEVAAIEAQQRTEREATQEAQRIQEEQARKAEQERLANLYRQAGNNFGNLRNTSKSYGYVYGRDYITTTINFGNGNYIEERKSALGLSSGPKTGTYRVNGDTVIFLSSEGEYKAGTIIGTALNIGGDIYR